MVFAYLEDPMFRRPIRNVIFFYLALVSGYWIINLFRAVRDRPVPYVTSKTISPRENYTGYNET